MDFKDQIKDVADRIEKVRGNLQTEEATKMALIVPFIQSLGYDVFNPLEVIPEMTCDIGTKKGEKIDYAIIKDGSPIILIECKHCVQDLNQHNMQLLRYFNVSKARFAILTNGIEYRFYTDLEKPNVMDENPFLVVNMLDLSDNDCEQLRKFHKSYYNEGDILSTAETLQISYAIRAIIDKVFENPSTEFVRYFVFNINHKSNQKLIDQYTPILKRCISEYVNDEIQARLNSAMNSKEQKQSQDISTEVEGEQQQDKSDVVTTQDEIDAYNIVRSILRKEVDITRVKFWDYKSYSMVYLDKSSRKWLCRFYFNWKKYIAIPDLQNGGSEVKLEIQRIEDIFNYSDKLIEIVKARL